MQRSVNRSSTVPVATPLPKENDAYNSSQKESHQNVGQFGDTSPNENDAIAEEILTEVFLKEDEEVGSDEDSEEEFQQQQMINSLKR
jgi:hypothetical protein